MTVHTVYISEYRKLTTSQITEHNTDQRKYRLIRVSQSFIMNRSVQYDVDCTVIISEHLYRYYIHCLSAVHHDGL